MPLYEYKCSSCGTVFEVMQKFTDEPLVTHQNCGGRVERLISPSALQFKGSGWYITDYARGSQGKSAGKNSNEGSASKEAKTEASSSKPEKPGK